jgi:hypothetical protein
VTTGPLGTFSVNVSGKIGTTTAVVSSVNPSVLFQKVTFTATVTPSSGSGVPKGTVTFRDNGQNLATVSLDASGNAVYSTSSLKLGNQNIVAVYNGSAIYSFSTSPVLTQVVNKDSTTTAIASSANPSVFGQSVVFTATVTAVAPGSGIPGGTVVLKDNGVTLATLKLDANGVATYTTSALKVGAHSLTFVYQGSASYTASTSTALSQVVNKDSTSTLLVSSVNPSVFGQSVTFTATVTANAPGSGVPTGTVTFRDNGKALATVTLNASGIAVFTTSTLPAGTQNIVATYNGSGSYKFDNSAKLVQIVNKASTKSTVVSSLNPAAFGQAVTFTLTVTPVLPGGGIPTGGKVTFFDGTTVLSTGTLNSKGVATFTISTLSVGTHRIIATFSGNADYKFSRSVVLLEVVDPAAVVLAALIDSTLNKSAIDQVFAT